MPFFVSLLVLIFPLFSHQNELLEKWKSTSEVSESLIQLHEQLSDLQSAFQQTIERTHGVEKIYICGTTSRALLDHIYLETPLNLKEFDVAILINHPLKAEDIKRVAQSLEQLKLSSLYQDNNFSRPRVSTSLPILSHLSTPLGYSFYIFTPDGKYLNLSFFENEEDMKQLDIVDIDSIKISIEKSDTLLSFYQEAHQKTFEELNLEKMILDPYEGYLTWVSKKPPTILWKNVKRDCHLHIGKLIRCLYEAKLMPLTKEYDLLFHSLCASEPPLETERLGEQLLKMLDDPDVAMELKTWQKVGIFNHWLPSLNTWIATATLDDIDQVCQKDVSTPKKLISLIEKLPHKDHLSTWYHATHKYNLFMSLIKCFKMLDPQIEINREAIRNLLEALSKEKRFNLEKQLTKIFQNQEYTQDVQLNLAVRAIIFAQNEMDPQTLLKHLFPRLSERYQEKRL